jgi:hypothetical protein
MQGAAAAAAAAQEEKSVLDSGIAEYNITRDPSKRGNIRPTETDSD